MSLKNLILPAVGVIAVAGGAAAYFYFKGAPIGSVNPAAIAKVIPDDAYMAAFISTDEKSWSQLEKFGTPEAQKIVGRGLSDLQQQLATNPQINYEKDLKPWVGNVMVAVMPSQAKAKEPSVLVAVGIKDKINAMNFANSFKSKANVKSNESDYKGVKIMDFADAKSTTYTSVVKDYLVLSQDRKAVEQAINTAKGDPSFATKAGNALSSDMDVQNPIARVYIPEYSAAVQKLLESSPETAQLQSSTIEQLKQVKSVVAGIGIDDAGLRLKARAIFDPNAKTVEYKPAPNTVVAQLPGETFALVNGAGLNRYWSQAVEQANTSSEAQLAFGGMRQYAKYFNLDLDKDVFAWMGGEFALSLVTADQGMLAQLGFGGILVFDTTDRATTEATLAKLDTLAKNNTLTVAQRDVQGKQVTEWKLPDGALLGHGWLDQDTVFVAIGEPLVNAMAAKPAPALDGSDTFKTVTATLPKQNAGYFFLDMDKLMGVMNRTMLASQPNSMTPETKAILDSIRGIGGTSVQSDKSTAQVELLLALKPAK
ncbi:DUF3352 domain-containing protein [Leptolyngbya sp. FACHB-36]|uniref:DUF3352 domain-containing protein n=1 Tax=Leptolyngbya sp. FACHB-36 TaxID=2692808 RepID=UPI001680DFBE|nr:DUF3352 domain-containing protein [Leptolyngbya sp. FACHB-36]MBD2021573.1 DUF3352 domain-containing protein [Leptolyngbya sp. FACHB-36]